MTGYTQVEHGLHYDVSNTMFVCESGFNHHFKHFSPFLTGGTHTSQHVGCGKHAFVADGFEGPH